MRYQDVEEELMKILAGGGQQVEGDVLAAINARTPSDASIAEAAENERLAAQGRLPGDMPRGTKVVFPMDVPMDVAAPEPTRTPIVPKVVDLTQESPDDLEMAYATAQDRKARQRDAFERGSRQLVAGLTRTNVAESSKRPADAVSMLMARRKERGAVQQRNETNRFNAAKLGSDQKEAARKTAEAKMRDERDFAEKEKEFAYRKENDALDRVSRDKSSAASLAMAGAGLGIRRDEAKVKQDERDDKESASDIAFLDGTLRLKPGLSDTERGQARAKAGDWNAADAAVANFQRELESYARNPSVESKGRVTAALRTASSAFNGAIGGGAMSADEARAMSDAMGADILSPSGVTAIAESVFGGDPAKAAATISSRVRAARQANKAAALGKLRASGDYLEGGGAAQPQDGKVTVTNGKETLRIPAARLADAERDGFKRVL